jgi:MFS family permease
VFLAQAIVLRNRTFGRLWLSQLQSNLGTWLMIVAVPVYVFRLTGSATGTGLALLAETVPALVVAPFAGLLADRWDRRLIMAWSDVLRAASVGCLLLATSQGRVWLLYLAILAENTFAQFFDPAYGAIIPAITGRDGELDAANAWSAVSGGVIRLVGGPLGGLLYVAFGFRPLVLIDCATYLVSSALVLSLPGRPGQPGRPVRPGQPVQVVGGELASWAAVRAELVAGVRFLRRDTVQAVLLATSALFLFGNAALTVVVVPFVVRVLHRGAADVGLLMAALGIGYLAGAPIGRRLSTSGRLRLGVAGCLVWVSGAFAGLFNCHQLPVAVVFIALAGVPGCAFLLLVRVQRQRRTPGSLLGRVGSAYATVQMAATVAGAVAGAALAARLGIELLADVALGPILAAAVLAATSLPTRVTRSPQQPLPPGSVPRLAPGPGARR